jgi:TusE/DsrC/DsvC family sulfur relay protein
MTATTKTELAMIAERLDALTAQVARLAERPRQDDLYDELAPVLRVVMGSAIGRLDALERDGTLAFVRELGGVGQKVLANFSAADVRQLGDAVVTILETVRTLTQPDVMRVAADAGDAIQHADTAKPMGLFGMMRATKDDDVQRGMAVMMEVLRRIGHGVNAMAAKQQHADDKKAKLAEILGPKRQRKVLGTERAAPPKALPAAPVVKAAPPAPACAVPSKPGQVAAVIDGVAFTADGNLVDAAAWTRGLAAALADAERVALTDAHWAVLEAARADFAATGSSPNIRRLTQVAGVVDQGPLRPVPASAPGRTIAKLAGLPKPAGCL